MSNYAAGVHALTPTVLLHVVEGDAPGPTALVQAGIHGDEIAGVHALEELLEGGLRPARGRLLVVPCMNPAAYRARTRAAPDGLDLNRCFPGDPESDQPERRLAAMFMRLIEHERPVMVATLHESLKRHHPEIAASCGQTLVYGVDPVPPEVVRVVARLNEHLAHPYERWAPHYYPVETSSTEVIVAATGCLGVCVETWSGFDLRRRVDMQKAVVRALLDEVGIGSHAG